MDVLGIDLAKLTCAATLRTTTGAQFYQSFPNTPDGMKDEEFIRKLNGG